MSKRLISLLPTTTTVWSIHIQSGVSTQFKKYFWWGIQVTILSSRGIGFTDRFASLAKYCPLVRGDQYRELVCAAGFEPATPCAQDTCATTALRTEVVGGVWVRACMMAWSIHKNAVSPAVSGFARQPPQLRLRIVRLSGQVPYVDSPERLQTLVQPNGQALSPCLSTLLFTNTAGVWYPNHVRRSRAKPPDPMRVGCW